ncbi:polysaccharide biosynthesis/export family protein [Candidatus Binatus sp.]|uniref:polysaccharide biosynthesis/export family protein n=1 Tax=Candidatus Binatus sp. TaxID=2811406 RepID=UPI00272D435C|nr:polysaccharide biosynthesis/export family protein [Candidatus Binatus sp.]
MAANALLLAIGLAACASAPPIPPEPAEIGRAPAIDPRVPSIGSSEINIERLDALWEKRATAKDSTDYPIGPGDVIEVSAPGVDDLKDRTVRVSGNGEVELPLIGIVQASGMSESGFRDRLKAALGKYMYDPQVDVFVKEYHSRQVAVVGAVRRPGLVVLTGSGDSILDVITQAGGMTPDAADEIVILPEVKGGRGKLAELAAAYAEPSRTAGKTVRPAIAKGQSPDREQAQGGVVDVVSLEQNLGNGPAVVIPLKTAMTGSRKYVNMPASPGDIIVVPGGGNVMVTGWVYKAGFFQVGSGLSVLGAVGAAGGAMFAADPTRATLIRSDGTGSKVSIPMNLVRISKGEDPDIPVRANDVIDVPYSDLKIAPYVVYNLLTRVPVPGYTF